MKSFMLGIFVLVAVIVASAYAWNRIPRQPAIPAPTDSGYMSSFSPMPVSSDLAAGGSSYRDPAGMYSFLYPNGYTLDAPPNDPHIRVFTRGETQRSQSEMSDGALIVFESIDLAAQPLSAWVDAQIVTQTQDGTSEVVRPKAPYTLGVYPGFTYELRGLGTSTTIAIQKDTTLPRALLITYMVSDPTNKGYQQQVNEILATVTLFE